ncbi:hypothetical protein SAMN05216505_102279 [Streptomyces prasinopilosus]|uniref:Uncharacterized protein n=1 Tax=Streptomyces prasinopilosus TaxID=67344 RepID=A0A1G6LVP6_9ACTN|nr:hypothetical protein SAMN05216505_102279 [Streptomyces prasinopilosus]
MDIDGTRVPVAGPTGVTGGAPTARPAGRGARPAPAGGPRRRAAVTGATAADAGPPRPAPGGAPAAGQHAR